MKDIIKTSLPNGTRVLLMPDSTVRTASIGIWVKSGVRYESAQNNGISHFIEHMLFKGTNSRSSFDIAEEADSVGAILNAFTAKEYTCFYARTLDQHLLKMADLISDMVLNPRLSEEDCEVEKGIICEEIGMYDDSPEDLMTDALYSSVWKSSPLGMSILGTRETVTSMTADTLKTYMKSMYTSDRIVIAASGNFDPSSLTEQLKNAFGGLQKSKFATLKYDTQYTPSVSTIAKDFEQTNFCICFPAFSQSDIRKYPLSLLNLILGASSSSRLFRKIREEKGLAYSVGSSSSLYCREGLFCIDAGINPTSEDAVFSEIVSVLSDIIAHGVTEKEFSRAKEQCKASVVMSLESTGSRASHMGRSELLEEKVYTDEEILKKIESVSVDDVNSVARDIIDFSKASVSVVTKKPSDEQRYIGYFR